MNDDANSYMNDLDEVRNLVELYIKGADGDVEKLEQTFHPDATMTGRIGEMADMFTPISGFMSMVATHPGAAGPQYRAEIRSIDISGDAGVAVLVETDYAGCDFVDYFTVARVDNRWWITTKTYAHMGGELRLPGG